jgi:hypothetical protein
VEEEIEVDMDGVWRAAQPPNWLTTYGVSTCIAVAVTCEQPKQAWLIHSPVFGHDPSSLENMLGDAIELAGSAQKLRVWACGGSPADGSAGACHEAKTAREVVVATITREIPPASIELRWLQGGDVEVMHEEGAWLFSLH